jgi:hypothetical protein
MKVLVGPAELERGIWSDFVRNHPRGTIFQTPEMFDVYAATRGMRPTVVGLLSNEGELAGVLCSVVQSEFPGMLRRLTARAVVRGGPLGMESCDFGRLVEAHGRAAVDAGSIYTVVSNGWETRGTDADLTGMGYQLEPALNFFVDLTRSESELWAAIHPTRRKQVARAERRGLEVRDVVDVGELPAHYALLVRTYRSVGLPVFDESLFRAAFEGLVPQGLMRVFGAYADGRLVGSRMVLAYGDTVHDWFAGSEREAKDLYPNDALVWAVLKAFAGGRWKRFDFGGAGRPDQPYGVREFKRKFGGEEVAFGTFRTVHRPLTYHVLTGARSLARRWTEAFPKAGRRNGSAAAPTDDGNARAATKEQA